VFEEVPLQTVGPTTVKTRLYMWLNGRKGLWAPLPAEEGDGLGEDEQVA